MVKKIAIIALLCILSFPLGARFAGSSEQETGIGTLSFHALPHFPGGGELYVPVADWGIGFRLFHSPILVRAEPRALDREGALQAATGEDSLLRSLEDDIYSGAREAVIRTLFVSLGIVFLLAFALWKALPSMGRLFPLQALLGGALVSFVVFALAALTYDPSSLQRPSFYARGAELTQILDAIERERDGGDGSYEDNFRKILASVSALLSENPLPAASGDQSFILASDLHSNALALPALGDLAEEKPLLFVGDFGLDGNDTEAALLASGIAEIGGRVLAVSGNHDSTALMEELARSGVEVLSSRGTLREDGVWRAGPVRVGGMSIRGWEDPLEWSGEPSDPRRQFSLRSSTGAQRELWSWWRGLREKPDILLLHQPLLAEFLADRLKNYPRPLTIVVGHDHQQWVAKKNNVFIVDGGSVGAGGVFGVGREGAEMAEIYFSKAGRSLRTVDMIQVSPLEGGGRAERIVASEICSLPCRYRVPALP